MSPIIIIEFIVLILSLIAAGFSIGKNAPFYLNITIAALMLLLLLGKL